MWQQRGGEGGGGAGVPGACGVGPPRPPHRPHTQASSAPVPLLPGVRSSAVGDRGHCGSQSAAEVVDVEDGETASSRHSHPPLGSAALDADYGTEDVGSITVTQHVRLLVSGQPVRRLVAVSSGLMPEGGGGGGQWPGLEPQAAPWLMGREEATHFACPGLDMEAQVRGLLSYLEHELMCALDQGAGRVADAARAAERLERTRTRAGAGTA